MTTVEKEILGSPAVQAPVEVPVTTRDVLHRAADLLERLFDDDPDTGCWIKRGYLRKDGYANVSWFGQTKLAHRVLAEVIRGPIPDGLTLDHLCRNRACANPFHLEPVTQRENTLRGTSPSAQAARRTHCPHGHEYTDANTSIEPYSGARRCRTCRNAQKTAGRARLREAAEASHE